MIKIFFKLKEQYIKTEMEYKFNFWMMLISGVLTRALVMAVPFVIYSNIPNIAGWQANEIYLIMSYLFIAEGLCSTLFEGIWQMPAMVFNGQFDTILSRPVSPLYQVLSYGMGLHGIGIFLFGIISMNVFLSALGKFHVATVLLSLFFIICGTLILMSSYLICNCLIFWFDAGGRTNIPYMVDCIGHYAKYPISIYPIVVQLILLFVIPYAFIGVVPVVVLRGEHVLMYCLSMIGISIFFLLTARFIFYRGIRRYESMGM